MQNNHFPGGKGAAGTYQKIINQMKPHDIYIVGFLGGGTIIRKKKPASINIAFDLDKNALDMLPDCEYSGLIELHHENFIDWLENNQLTINQSEQRILFYLDPPYLMTTRKSKKEIYRYEMSRAEHERLLNLIVGLNCDVMISGYWSNLYEAYLSEWRVITFLSQTRGGTPGLENLWLNFAQPLRLHDYSFLGENATQRQNIKRKAERWKNRLLHLDPREAAAIMREIDNIKD